MSFGRPSPAQQRERREAERDANLRALVASPAERRGIYVGTTTAPAPKENVLHSTAYQTAVRTLPCARCGIVGFTQFCHADMDKGTGIKTDDRRGWAGCGPHGGRPGCHWLIGTSGTFPKPVRRALEFLYAAWTRARILELGLWPKRLPMLEEKQL